jgi:hypothetical protein
MSKEYNVQDAQQLIASLQARRDACVKHGVELSDERASLSFAAHGEGDAKAKKRLSEVHDALVRHASELSSLDDALRVAGDRLAAAKRLESEAADHVKARSVLALVDEMDSEIHSLARAADVLVASLNALVKLHTKAVQLGASRPTRMQLDAMTSRAISSMLMLANMQGHIGSDYLPPDQRKEFTALLQYSQNIRADAAARLGDETKKEAA